MVRGSEVLIIVVCLIPTAVALLDAVRIGESRWQTPDQNLLFGLPVKPKPQIVASPTPGYRA